MEGKKKKIILPLNRANEEQHLMVGINGKTWLIPRGVEVEVPEYVAREYERALAAEHYMVEKQHEALEKALKS